MNRHQLTEDEIFRIAYEIPSPDARIAYLKQVCRDDVEVERIIALLKEGAPDASFLENGPAAYVETIDRPAAEDMTGESIGRYKLLQPIGEGGFGVVYMAEQFSPVRRKVALKLIKPGMDTKQVIARFEAERQALALMNHPNVARVFDGGSTEAGRPYFVMELVKGVPFTEYCDQNQLPNNERLALFVTVCQAVQHAHQKGIIHRDLKPSNILVTLHDGKPVIKVIDFGVAKAIDQQLTEKTLFTNYGQMVGTPQYMSPEQAERSGLDVDTRCDVYSLGVVLYELLTGTTPLEANRLREVGFMEMQRLIKEEEPPKPSTRVSGIGPQVTTAAKFRGVSPDSLRRAIRGDLDWIVMKALEKDRTRRYETASGFAEEIGRYLNDEPVTAVPPTWAYRSRKFVNRHRTVIGIAAGYLVLSLICTTWIWYLYASSQSLLVGLQNELVKQATVAALSGKTSKSDPAIERCRQYQVGDGQCTILEALAQFHAGELQEAATKAATLMEEKETAIAGASILFSASFYAGSPEPMSEAIAQLENADPQSDLDMLLMSQAILYQRPEDAWKYTQQLKKAGSDWQALLAVNAMATILRAMEIYEDQERMLEEIESAVDELKYLAMNESDNQYIVTEYFQALLYALDLSSAMDRADKEASRRNDVDALIERVRRGGSPGGLFENLVAYYSVRFGAGVSEEQWLDVAHLHRLRTLMMTSFREFGGDNPDGVTRILQGSGLKNTPSWHLFEAFFDIAEAETKQKRDAIVNDLWDTLRSDDQYASEADQLAIYVALFAGDLDQAQAMSGELLSRDFAFPSRWNERCGRYLMHPTADAAAQLKREAGPFAVGQSYVYFTCGMTAWANGDLGEANDCFKVVIKAGKIDWFNYCVADALLNRMENDEFPNWIVRTDKR